MDDRFKFRVFDIEDKIMSDVLEIHYSIGSMDVVGYDFKPENKTYQKTMSLYPNKEDNECFLMQCTGLKDKNGNLIYEGDILKGLFADNLLIIENSGWEFNATSLNKKYGNYFLSCELKGFEIIGNIYENPELLEQD